MDYERLLQAIVIVLICFFVMIAIIVGIFGMATYAPYLLPVLIFAILVFMVYHILQ